MEKWIQKDLSPKKTQKFHLQNSRVTVWENADEVNLELKDRYFDPPPYKPGSKVVEYVPKGWEPEYGRIYDSKNPTNKASRFVTDLEYVKKNSISKIMKDMKVDAKKDAKAKVRIPEETKLRIGEVNQGNGKQHEIVEFDKPQVKKILDWNQIND